MNNLNEYSINNTHVIIEIDRFVRQTLSLAEPGYQLTSNENGGVEISLCVLGQYFHRVNVYLSHYRIDHFYSEYVQLFFDACATLRIDYGVLNEDPCFFYPVHGKLGAQLFNELLEEMRAASRTPEFRKKCYDRQHRAAETYQSCVDYIVSMFVHYSRLMVLRLDFGYCKAHYASIEQAQQDIERYLNNRRGNSLFDKRVGYIIKLEYTVEKGPHFHCFFFLDGSLVKEKSEIYYAQQYCNYWKKITAERGITHNCNMNKYRYPGIGMIDHANMQMRQNLLRPIQYISKSEQELVVKASAKLRTLWRGKMLGERTHRVGRPRTKGLEFPGDFRFQSF